MQHSTRVARERVYRRRWDGDGAATITSFRAHLVHWTVHALVILSVSFLIRAARHAALAVFVRYERQPAQATQPSVVGELEDAGMAARAGLTGRGACGFCVVFAPSLFPLFFLVPA